jgi:hypothetical protein
MWMSVGYFSAYPHIKHTFKNESCHGGKRSKDRITVLNVQIWMDQKDAITGNQNNTEVKVLQTCEVTAM